MPEAHVGTNTEYLSLSPDPEFGPPDRAIVRLRLDGLTAATTVVSNYANGFLDLAEFFQSLAEHWRGWSDLRLWESLEGELRIEARHQYGHVQLRVTLQRVRADWGNAGWQAVGDLTIEPGEQLSQVAHDILAFARG